MRTFLLSLVAAIVVISGVTYGQAKPTLIPVKVELIYEEGLTMTRNMAACAQGFRDMFGLGYGGIEKYRPTDFYDDSFIKELDSSGFIAAAYKTAR